MRYLVAPTVLVAALCAAEVALACSCVRIVPRDQLRGSDGAVVARLLAVRPVEDGNIAFNPGPADFVYRTGRVIKGAPQLAKGRPLTIRSSDSSASCGLSGTPGELTGLFLTRNGGRWTSSSCQQISASSMRKLRLSKAGSRPTAVCGDALALVARAVASAVSQSRRQGQL